MIFGFKLHFLLPVLLVGQILICPASAVAQKSGKVKYRYPSGRTSAKGKLLNGLKTGRWITWYDSESNQMKSLSTYKNDTLHGVYMEWDSLGGINATGVYQHGQKNGEWKYSHQGSLNRVCFYRKDLLEGQFRSYRFGNLIESGWYKNNLKEGRWYLFFRDGSLYAEETYSKGKLNGMAYRYYPDKKKRSQIGYEEGKCSGSFQYFTKTGGVILEGNYSNGNREGTWKFMPKGVDSVYAWEKKFKNDVLISSYTNPLLKPNQRDWMYRGEFDLKFIFRFIRFPEYAKEFGEEGRVIVAFTIDKAGDVANYEVLKHFGFGSDDDAMYLLRLLPTYPRILDLSKAENGKQRFVLPIRFKLD